MQGQSTVDITDYMILFAMLAVGVGVMIWWNEEQIIGMWQQVDLILLAPLSYLPFGPWGELREELAALEPSQLRYEHVLLSSSYAGRPWSTLLAGVLGYAAWKAWRRRRQYSNRRLTYQQITGVLGSRFPERGRQQLTVEQWLHHYKIDQHEIDSPAWRKKVEQALKAQLTRTGRAKRDDEVLLRIAERLGLKSPRRRVALVVKLHAYRATAAVRLFADAKELYGVVREDQFIDWMFSEKSLIPIWFALNSAGRQTGHAEALGIMTHYYQEHALGRAKTRLDLAEAVDHMAWKAMQHRNQGDDDE